MIEQSMTSTTAYTKILREILESGTGLETQSNLGEIVKMVELFGPITIWPMYNPIMPIAQRNLSYRFMYAEAAWILSGSNDAADIIPYCKNIVKYLDEGSNKFFGAYGPPVISQLPYIAKTLKNDPTSRRAVLTIWRPAPPNSKDIPCTISLHFMFRSGRLHTNVYMRSSDAWWGLPYDVFNFSCITAMLSLMLWKPPLGRLMITHGSLHIYERFANQAKELTLMIPALNETTGFNMSEFNDYRELLRLLKDRRDGKPTTQQSIMVTHGGN